MLTSLSPPSSSSLSLFFLNFFIISLSLRAQAIVLSIFFSPSGCCFSVNCFQLITRSLTHYSFLLSSFPAAAAAPSSSASPPSSLHPSTLLFTPCSPSPLHLHITLSGSVSFSLCLFSRRCRSSKSSAGIR